MSTLTTNHIQEEPGTRRRQASSELDAYVSIQNAIDSDLLL